MIDNNKLEFTEQTVSRLSQGLDYGNWTLNEKIALSCRMLAMQGHSRTLAGQITVRCEDNTYLTTPLAVGFDEISASRILRVDNDLQVLEGQGVPNPAVRFHLWVYHARPDVNCIIHTHPPHVSALSMTGRPLKVSHMDATPFANDCGFLKEWPGLPIADQEGEIIAAALGSYRSVLLAHHGFLCATSSVEETAYLSMLIENAAEMQLLAEATGPIQELNAELAKESHDFLLKSSIVRASFAMFARRAEAKWGKV